MKICILTFGTRGDVQPYIALGVGLKAAGHTVTLATLEEFNPQVFQYGLEFDRLRGDFLKAAQEAENQSGGQKRETPSSWSLSMSPWRAKRWRMSGPAPKRPTRC